jgi:acid phosphatase family membrane protein YuiD
MYFRDLIANDVLWVSIIANSLAQFLKPFTHWVVTRDFDWHRIADNGGMPSSHSALVSAATLGIGIQEGFNSPLFAVAVVLTMIVTYDAAGVRRAAGEHGRAINLIIAEVLSGNPIDQPHFKEVLGHSRKEVAAGIVFGMAIMLLWKLVIQSLLVS